MTRESRKLMQAIAAASVALSVGLVGAPCYAAAGELTYFGAGGVYHVHLTTLQQLKFRTVIRQKYDFSCGSAAIASLLSFHYGIPTKEMTVFSSMWKHGNRRKIEKEGFSMLDMKKYLARRGLRSNGFRSTLDRVAKAGVPGIVLLDLGGYLHFVVVEGVKQGRVLIADPATGTRTMSAEDFKKAWNGIYFVVLNDVREARATFNRASAWAVQPRAPVDMARNITNLGNFLLSLPARNVF